ncbi:hypothetical protein MKW98_011216 [Papaver atlanticum]|uniref:Uncharacterized protein n=1 Tax=Papaver atlanticum TaxID=357466 RepID=A0AAD4RYJ5_9MAGN|nr:hypothetical protein MKW98_011216 [Papaver atlanticum]
MIQYWIVCQQVNVGFLEEVIKHFLHLSTEKAENAKTQAEALEEALDVDDLEANKRPEDLMLSYVGGEKGKDRSDCELVVQVSMGDLQNETPKPSLMVVYYGKLTEIFRVSDNQLYNAYAWHLTQKDLQLIAFPVVLAALSVTPYDHGYGASHLELENEKERNLRMANLICFSLDPKRDSREVLSRSALLSELVFKGMLACASPEVKEIYNLLEHEFLPLDLASRVQPLLGSISNVGGKISSASSVPEVQLLYYVPALEKLATLRLLQKVSQAYQSTYNRSCTLKAPVILVFAYQKHSTKAKACGKAGDLVEIRGDLLNLHRIFTLRRDELGQETLLNLLLCNYLHYNTSLWCTQV